MFYLEGLIVHCLERLNGERTVFSIYHLLRGKKSSQTIQDAHLFGLTKYFGVYPLFTRELLEKIIKHCLDHEGITLLKQDCFLLTPTGKNRLQEYCSKLPEPFYLNGWKYHQIDLQFWERLSLMVQVTSNFIASNTRYIPIQKKKETHKWIKTFLKECEVPRNRLGNKLHSEILRIFQMAEQIDPSVLIFRLTGYNKIGLTAGQTAERLKMEPFQYQLEFLNILHYLIRSATDHADDFPLLSAIIDNRKQNQMLTNSTQKTYDLLQNGYTIEEIARIRDLKKNTIEDHIVEIALKIDNFPIDPYIEKELQEKILGAAQQTASRQLKLIRSKVEAAEYFKIRLVLAKHGVKQ